MTRTPHQIAADEALTAAIEEVWAAYHAEAHPGVVLEYVVLARRRSYHPDTGAALTTNALLPRDNDVPLDLLLGLTELAATRLRAIAAD